MADTFTAPSGRTYPTNTGNALVLEGGGFRGMFTAGVLDVLMEHGVYDFDTMWGVSAGALNAVSFKSRQIGRTMRIMLAFRDDRRFMSIWSLATTGNLAGGDFMYHEVEDELDPNDDVTFNENPLRFFAVASDITFGTPAYNECAQFPRDVAFAQASASMPLVSRTMEVDGHRYLDGGTTDSIPFEVALGREGTPVPEGVPAARRALVVITQDRSYRKSGRNEQLVVRSRRYDGFPYYLEALSSRAGRYNAKRERLFALEQEPESPVLVLGPDKPVEVATNERDGGRLLALYLEGRRMAEGRLDEIRAFLAGEA